MHLRFALANRLDAPRKARTAVTEIEREVDPMVAAKTRLLVSELVTNATRHGHGQITVDVETSPRGVRASVTDQGDGFAPPSEGGEILAESGRGLLLVRRLADSWGVAEGSTVVWFEVGARARDRVPLRAVGPR
jgi:anti-sigma regulatory factor (Ser/Thr protein kinase)